MTSGFGGARTERSRRYPWYDSGWLAAYADARAIIRARRPQALAAFEEACRVFHTRPDFSPPVLAPFDESTLAGIRTAVAALRPTDLELHEARRFGRFVVHNHPLFNVFHDQLVPLVSAAAGEAVEPTYNFLSLYTARGVCPIHMDAPDAKWTLDLCVDQSAPWPIHVSQVVPWPEWQTDTWGEEWERAIRESPAHHFTSSSLEPGEAVVFSGSSQWHYRDPIPEAAGTPFCTALFFHFIPRGTAALLRPENWARLFGVPELDEIG